MSPRRTMLVFMALNAVVAAVGAQSATEKAASPQVSAALDAVLAADRLRFEASVQADRAALERVLGADLTYCHSHGGCDDKKSFIDALASGKSRYKVFTPTEQKPRLYGDFAVINGKARVTVVLNASEMSFDLVYTDVFAKRDGRWQMVAWQSTRLPETPRQ